MLRYLYDVISGGGRQSLSVNGLDRLISNDAHSSLLQRRRARVILSRVRLLALIAFLAFPLGFGLDYATFSLETYITLGICRGLIALLCLILFLGILNGETMRDAHRALGIFFAILLTFQALYQPILDVADLTAIKGIATAGYVLFPFVIAACIAVFPLTVKEAFLTLTLFFIVQMLILILLPEQADPHQRLGILLCLVLIGVLSSFASICQLLYMSLLIDQASIDTLTQCYSRNSGEEIIDVQFKIAKREKSPLSIVFIDLDNFKAVNDRYGHEAGDRVLATAAQHIRRNGRGSDVLIRWGGEEFVALLPNTNLEGALKSVRRLRNIGLGKRPDGSYMTASYGIAEMQLAGAASWNRLVDLADDQMYIAKSKGGNDIALFEPAAVQQKIDDFLTESDAAE
ncbi:MAG: GGDEF domain-containing protein [Alphaproteobacteria bacterium]|nr:MAG: GGDEF domain-containing protein [Alphaproteobacteria bacterium]